ncbi:DoxX family protein [Dietzia kunjamensis]|nr:hypothetical protein [Dietzia kunjamensis]
MNSSDRTQTTPGSRPPSRRRRSAGEIVRHVGRWALGAALLGAGTGHLTTMREEFQAQVPTWVPLDPDFVVVASGVVELGLGAALIFAPTQFRPAVGGVTAAFFIAIFPGNISQYVTGTDAFGLDSDRARLVRLFFQPVLVAWALWSTGAWRAWRNRNA